jgi:hypothetical protein
MTGPRRDWLADAEEASRRLAADAGLLIPDEVECANQCGRWIALGSEASCNHDPAVCDDCYPNGCVPCEWQVHEISARREEATNRIANGALAIQAGSADLTDTDLRELGWIVRNDLLRHIDVTVEALRRMRDVINAEAKRTA